MTRIDFYILENDDIAQRNVFVCRLAEKAWRMGNAIHIHTSGLTEAEELDRLLWESRADTFIPHAIAPTSKNTPIHIGYGTETGHHHALLISLCNEVPLFFSRFDRVAEIVVPSQTQLTASRERFRFYRERGYLLEFHKIAASGAL